MSNHQQVLGEVPMLDALSAGKIAMAAASSAAARKRGEVSPSCGEEKMAVVRAVVATRFLAALTESWAFGPVGLPDPDNAVEEAWQHYGEEAEDLVRVSVRAIRDLLGDTTGEATAEGLAEGLKAILSGASLERAARVALDGSFEVL